MKNEHSDAVAIYGAWDGFHFVGGFDKELIDLCKSLKIVSVASVGHDAYASKYMKEKGIILTNAPSKGFSDDDVADVALYLTLSTFRFFQKFEAQFRKDASTFKARGVLHTSDYDLANGKSGTQLVPGFSFGHVAGGKTVRTPSQKNAAIIGFGAIGQEVGKRLSAIGMKIHYTKRSALKKDEIPAYAAVRHESLETILPIADVVVFCVPGLPENRHLFNVRTLDLLPERGSRIVNVGRGMVVEEQALVQGLKSGKIISCGLDVYEKEPFVSQELLARDDVILLPHVGSSTIEVYDLSALMALRQIKNFFEGKAVEHVVN